MPIFFKLQITTCAVNGKIQLTPKITNLLFTCYLNYTCKSNPVCLIQQWSVIFLLAFYPLHRYEFGPLKFFSKTFKFSMIFYSTWQTSGGGQWPKACRFQKKEPKQSEITWKQSEPVRSISTIEKRRLGEFVRHCPKDSFKRLYTLKGLLVLVKKLNFQKNFGQNFVAVEGDMCNDITF